MGVNESSVVSTNRRDVIVMVRWALIIACAYLILFSDKSSGALGLSPLVIAVFLGSNLVVGRLQPEVVGTQRFNISIAVLDTVLIGASLFFAGQLSVELVVLCLGILFLAVAGLSLGVITTLTLGMTLAYMLMVWVAGTESLLRSSMLLRVPFVLCAAIVFGWLTDAGGLRRSVRDRGSSSAGGVLATDLAVQLEAIRRCRTALLEGSPGAARAALDDIAAANQEMQAKLADHSGAGVKVSPMAARDAA